MFAPKGYTPLAALMRKVPDGLRHEAVELVRSFAEGSAHGESWVVGLLSGTSPLDIIEDTVLRSLGDSAHIAGINGELLAFDLQSLMGKIMDIWEYTVEDLHKAERMSQGGTPVPEGYAMINRLGEWGLKEMMTGFEQRGDQGLVDWLDESVFFCSTYQRLPMFVERSAYTVNLDAFEILGRHAEFRIGEFDGVRKILKPFAGWSICVETEFAKDAWAPALWSQMEAAKSAGGIEHSILQKAGRPNELSKVATEAYLALYPEGHGEVAIKVLSSQISDRIGRQVSERTVSRIVKSAKPPQSTAKTIGTSPAKS